MRSERTSVFRGVQMTAAIKTLHRKCNTDFWTAQGPKLLQKLRPTKNHRVCRQKALQCCYCVFLLKIQRVPLLQVPGMRTWGSVITAGAGTRRNTAVDVLISLASRSDSEKGALIYVGAFSRNCFLALCRLWQHGDCSWLRLGALDSCDASRLSMHVPMCRPQSCSTSFPPCETWMNILVVVMNDAHPSF